VINSGGIKLSPELIEEKLAAKLNRRFFVAGQPDPDLGQRLVLVIEGEPYQLPEETFKKLDKYERPKEIIFKPKFKETGNGKIIRLDSLNA
jgi:O-succinylbenzoic acid--CoA ligase